MHHYLHQQPFTKNALSSFLAQYRRAVTIDSLGMVEGRLIFFEKVATSANQICRIVVPIFLRHIILCLLHASPAAGHMGEYKALYRIRLRFFWLRMRFDIHQWIKECPHCRLNVHWRRWGHELMFS